MEENKRKSIHDILPLDLIHIILLRIPVKHLGRLRCVSKLWHSLISDPDFAESHLHLSLAPTHACIYRKVSTKSYLVHLEEVFNGDNYQVKDVSFPFKKQPPSKFRVMGSCRGKGRYFYFPDNAILYEFGYDATRDDYLVVVAWKDSNCQLLDCLSLRTNSWINLDAALPKRFGFCLWESEGLF
ncbi:hypothetical protein AHAS_Ahas03G0166200 [Arachis hypogaea]